MGSVYLIRNNINGKVYVGKTERGVNSRWQQHIKDSQGRCRSVIAKAIRKYGPKNFSVSTLTTTSLSTNLNSLERFWIAELHSIERIHGYNRTHGADGQIHTEETKTKISKKATGRKHTPAARDKMSRARKGKTPTWLVGKKLTAAHLAKLVAAKNTQEYHDKTSATHKALPGHSHTTESKSKIATANHNRVWTKESRQRLSTSCIGRVPSNKGVPHSAKTRAKMRKAWQHRRTR